MYKQKMLKEAPNHQKKFLNKKAKFSKKCKTQKCSKESSIYYLYKRRKKLQQPTAQDLKWNKKM